MKQKLLTTITISLLLTSTATYQKNQNIYAQEVNNISVIQTKENLSKIISKIIPENAKLEPIATGFKFT